MSFVLILVELAVAVAGIVGMWKVFEKAGQPGWAAIIPFYNVIVLLQIVNRPIWWFFVCLIPCIGFPILALVFGWMVTQDLAKSFGKDMGFGIGLFFLGFVFYPILGFGDAKYIGPPPH
ncbi:signal peptidase I [Planctomycetaceae bacterium SCGC AG-212-F19]|nr:signal peptidase I [Planctomycetaceae bacterium SCGC AG-212-F19]